MTRPLSPRGSTFPGAVLAAAFVLVAPALVAQERFTGETTVNVVEVPVRVWDPETRREVTGLTAEDFTLLEDGRPRELSNFAEVSRTFEAGAVAPDADAAFEERAVEVVYFFDLYLMYSRDRDRAVEGLRQLYRSGLAAVESVSLVAYDGTLETLIDRSNDHREVLAALDDVAGIEARGFQQVLSFTEDLADAPVSGGRNLDFYERRQRSREYIFELEKRVARVGEAITAAMARHARADARKVLVAFTPGHPDSNWSPTYAPIDFLNAEAEYPAAELWRKTALEASDLGFTLYVVDSSGLRTSTAGEAGSSTAPLSDDSYFELQRGDQPQIQDPEGSELEQDDFSRIDPNISSRQNLGQWLERTRKNLLISATDLTGGETLFKADIAAAVAEVRDHLDHSYSLAYIADHSGDGREHEIEVRVRDHPEYRVVHRRAYVDRPASVRTAQRLRSEMLFGGDANPLGVRVEVGEADSRFRLGAAGSKRVRIPFEVKIPYARVEMISRGDVYWGKVQVTFFAVDAAGNQSQLASAEVPLTVAADAYREAVTRGYFAYRTTVEIEGGEQNVWIGIEDLTSGQTSIVPFTFGS